MEEKRGDETAEMLSTNLLDLRRQVLLLQRQHRQMQHQLEQQQQMQEQFEQLQQQQEQEEQQHVSLIIRRSHRRTRVRQFATEEEGCEEGQQERGRPSPFEGTTYFPSSPSASICSRHVAILHHSSSTVLPSSQRFYSPEAAAASAVTPSRVGPSLSSSHPRPSAAATASLKKATGCSRLAARRTASGVTAAEAAALTEPNTAEQRRGGPRESDAAAAAAASRAFPVTGAASFSVASSPPSSPARAIISSSSERGNWCDLISPSSDAPHGFQQIFAYVGQRLRPLFPSSSPSLAPARVSSNGRSFRSDSGFICSSKTFIRDSFSSVSSSCSWMHASPAASTAKLESSSFDALLESTYKEEDDNKQADHHLQQQQQTAKTQQHQQQQQDVKRSGGVAATTAAGAKRRALQMDSNTDSPEEGEFSSSSVLLLLRCYVQRKDGDVSTGACTYLSPSASFRQQQRQQSSISSIEPTAAAVKERQLLQDYLVARVSNHWLLRVAADRLLPPTLLQRSNNYAAAVATCAPASASGLPTADSAAAAATEDRGNAAPPTVARAVQITADAQRLLVALQQYSGFDVFENASLYSPAGSKQYKRLFSGASCREACTLLSPNTAVEIIRRELFALSFDAYSPFPSLQGRSVLEVAWAGGAVVDLFPLHQPHLLAVLWKSLRNHSSNSCSSSSQCRQGSPNDVTNKSSDTSSSNSSPGSRSSSIPAASFELLVAAYVGFPAASLLLVFQWLELLMQSLLLFAVCTTSLAGYIPLHLVLSSAARPPAATAAAVTAAAPAMAGAAVGEICGESSWGDGGAAAAERTTAAAEQQPWRGWSTVAAVGLQALLPCGLALLLMWDARRLLHALALLRRIVDFPFVEATSSSPSSFSPPSNSFSSFLEMPPSLVDLHPSAAAVVAEQGQNRQQHQRCLVSSPSSWCPRSASCCSKSSNTSVVGRDSGSATSEKPRGSRTSSSSSCCVDTGDGVATAAARRARERRRTKQWRLLRGVRTPRRWWGVRTAQSLGTFALFLAFVVISLPPYLSCVFPQTTSRSLSPSKNPSTSISAPGAPAASAGASAEKYITSFSSPPGLSFKVFSLCSSACAALFDSFPSILRSLLPFSPAASPATVAASSFDLFSRGNVLVGVDSAALPSPAAASLSPTAAAPASLSSTATAAAAASAGAPAAPTCATAPSSASFSFSSSSSSFSSQNPPSVSGSSSPLPEFVNPTSTYLDAPLSGASTLLFPPSSSYSSSSRSLFASSASPDFSIPSSTFSSAFSASSASSSSFWSLLTSSHSFARARMPPAATAAARGCCWAGPTILFSSIYTAACDCCCLLLRLVQAKTFYVALFFCITCFALIQRLACSCSRRLLLRWQSCSSSTHISVNSTAITRRSRSSSSSRNSSNTAWNNSGSTGTCAGLAAGGGAFFFEQRQQDTKALNNCALSCMQCSSYRTSRNSNGREKIEVYVHLASLFFTLFSLLLAMLSAAVSSSFSTTRSPVYFSLFSLGLQESLLGFFFAQLLLLLFLFCIYDRAISKSAWFLFNKFPIVFPPPCCSPLLPRGGAAVPCDMQLPTLTFSPRSSLQQQPQQERFTSQPQRGVPEEPPVRCARKKTGQGQPESVDVSARGSSSAAEVTEEAASVVYPFVASFLKTGTLGETESPARSTAGGEGNRGVEEKEVQREADAAGGDAEWYINACAPRFPFEKYYLRGMVLLLLLPAAAACGVLLPCTAAACVVVRLSRRRMQKQLLLSQRRFSGEAAAAVGAADAWICCCSCHLLLALAALLFCSSSCCFSSMVSKGGGDTPRVYEWREPDRPLQQQQRQQQLVVPRGLIRDKPVSASASRRGNEKKAGPLLQQRRSQQQRQHLLPQQAKGEAERERRHEEEQAETTQRQQQQQTPAAKPGPESVSSFSLLLFLSAGAAQEGLLLSVVLLLFALWRPAAPAEGDGENSFGWFVHLSCAQQRASPPSSPSSPPSDLSSSPSSPPSLFASASSVSSTSAVYKLSRGMRAPGYAAAAAAVWWLRRTGTRLLLLSRFPFSSPAAVLLPPFLLPLLSCAAADVATSSAAAAASSAAEAPSTRSSSSASPAAAADTAAAAAAAGEEGGEGGRAAAAAHQREDGDEKEEQEELLLPLQPLQLSLFGEWAIDYEQILRLNSRREKRQRDAESLELDVTLLNAATDQFLAAAAASSAGASAESGRAVSSVRSSSSSLSVVDAPRAAVPPVVERVSAGVSRTITPPATPSAPRLHEDKAAAVAAAETEVYYSPAAASATFPPADAAVTEATAAAKIDRQRQLEVERYARVVYPFMGEWILDRGRSESMSDLSQHLGVPWVVRRAVEKLVPVNAYAFIPETKTLVITTTLKIGLQKTLKLNLGGSETTQSDEDAGGAWKSTTKVEEDCLRTVQKNDALKATLFETRKVVQGETSDKDILQYTAHLHKEELAADVVVHRYFVRLGDPPPRPAWAKVHYARSRETLTASGEGEEGKEQHEEYHECKEIASSPPGPMDR